jgi:hypothetical protein
MAQSPQATLVTRLQYAQLPEHIARQLPDLPSIIWVEPSSTGISRPRGALNFPGWAFTFTAAAYNLVRMRHLLAV